MIPIARSPGRAIERILALPKISLVKFHAALLQEFQILLLKRFLSVMFFLPSNISFDFLKLRPAYGKRTVAILPREQRTADYTMNPFGGVRFYLPHHISQTVCRLEAGQNVHMIASPSDLFRHSAQSTEDAAQIAVQSVLPGLSDPARRALVLNTKW